MSAHPKWVIQPQKSALWFFIGQYLTIRFERYRIKSATALRCLSPRPLLNDYDEQQTLS